MSGAGWGPPGPPGPGPGYGPPAGYGPPPGYGAPLPGPAPGAVVALVLGVVALVGGMTCLLPILAAPVAWVFGHRAVRFIDRSEAGAYTGRGMAMAGWVLGVVGTVLLVLGIAAAVVLVVLASNGTFDPPEPTPTFDHSPDLGARLLGT
ncbi:MAG: DUF4190 domain-containing protein [Nocardioidaceae bacterium]|nr:DUF4190 domain-containing protein [Nocardioidaceae bacterium]